MKWVAFTRVHISAKLILLVAGNEIQRGGVKFNTFHYNLLISSNVVKGSAGAHMRLHTLTGTYMPQHKQCTYKVTLRRICATNAAPKKQYYIF